MATKRVVFDQGNQLAGIYIHFLVLTIQGAIRKLVIHNV